MSVLIDTSVWVDHFRNGNDALTSLILREKQLYGLGCGLVDITLLASTLLTPAARLWTMDKRLAALAQRFDVAYG